MKGIGKVRRAHSFACFTPASILGYLMNFNPIGLDMGRLYPYRKWSWLPTELKNDGYSTAFLTSNAVIAAMDISLDNVFKKSFTLHESLKYDGLTTADTIVRDAIDFLSSHTPAFMFLLLMETHAPMFDGKKAKIPYPIQRPSSVFEFQRRAVEYIDVTIKPLFESLRNRKNPNDIIITSDHGDLLGPVKWGHNPSDLTLTKKSMIHYSEDLFEIPFVRGSIE
jgi:phosphoglycerol transferase MdoB-like AlkP superfamily enzyme